jgi:ubiquinone/menaquinone biosynthesis C-methylase UbiE
MSMSDEMHGHYSSCEERERLSGGAGRLELLRSQEIITRFLPGPPAVILDVGGGAGVYSFWLAERGYETHLIDPVELHIEQAREQCQQSGAAAPASVSIGDARRLGRADASVDAVLLLGPLYHLTSRDDRVLALSEAGRVLKPGGVVFAATISRFVSLLEGLNRNLLDDPAFVSIVDRDLREGQHRNPSGHPAYFTTAFFHRPDEIPQEIEDADLVHETTLAVEGPLWMATEFDRQWDDPEQRRLLLDFLRRVETEPSILGVSAHMLTVARRR